MIRLTNFIKKFWVEFLLIGCCILAIVSPIMGIVVNIAVVGILIGRLCIKKLIKG